MIPAFHSKNSRYHFSDFRHKRYYSTYKYYFTLNRPKHIPTSKIDTTFHFVLKHIIKKRINVLFSKLP